jgi:hypothetical protein
MSGLAMVAIIATNIALSLVPMQASARVEPANCKVEVIDCPGWNTGDRQVCHQNGTGLTCTCGQSTTCPESTATPAS